MDRIYFDPDDEAADGKGWNVVEGPEGEIGGALALRFATEEQARAYVAEQQA